MWYCSKAPDSSVSPNGLLLKQQQLSFVDTLLTFPPYNTTLSCRPSALYHAYLSTSADKADRRDTQSGVRQLQTQAAQPRRAMSSYLLQLRRCSKSLPSSTWQSSRSEPTKAGLACTALCEQQKCLHTKDRE